MRGGQDFGVFRVEFGLFLPLFLLHSAVLKPDFDLRFVEAQSGGDFDATSPRQIFVKVEFFLQFRQLLVGKVGPA